MKSPLIHVIIVDGNATMRFGMVKSVMKKSDAYHSWVERERKRNCTACVLQLEEPFVKYLVSLYAAIIANIKRWSIKIILRVPWSDNDAPLCCRHHQHISFCISILYNNLAGSKTRLAHDHNCLTSENRYQNHYESTPSASWKQAHDLLEFISKVL